MRSTFNQSNKAVFDYRGFEPSGDSTSDDRTTFSRLYDHYAPLMLGVILKTSPDKAEAAVILEQSFKLVWQQLDELKMDSQPLFVCMLKIVRRVTSDALAKRRQSGGASLHLTGKGNLIKVVPQKKNPSVTEPTSGKGLDTQQQTFLDAMLFHNCTPEEAAASAGIPASQARQQVRLAMQQLRNLPLNQ